MNRVFNDMLSKCVDDSSMAVEKLDSGKCDVIHDIMSRHGQPFTQEKLEHCFVTMDDFLLAVKKVQPSAKREGFATVPNVTWEDIGSLASVSFVCVP